MIIVKELKHNKFQDVNIPSAADLFARVGPRESDTKDYSGSEYLDPTLSKVEAAKATMIADVESQETK